MKLIGVIGAIDPYRHKQAIPHPPPMAVIRIQWMTGVLSRCIGLPGKKRAQVAVVFL